MGLAMIIYVISPSGKAIDLCEANILKGGLLVFFPRGLIYFVLGLLYGLVPIAIAGISLSKWVKVNSMTEALKAGSIFAAFLVPFFIVQCPEFAFGLIFFMALGITAGSVSGVTASLWLLNRLRVEAL